MPRLLQPDRCGDIARRELFDASGRTERAREARGAHRETLRAEIGAARR